MGDRPGARSASPHLGDHARIWGAAERIVYSRALRAAWTARTRIEPELDAEQVQELRASSERDLTIGGRELAAHAFRAGLVDELQLFVAPVGGGKRCLPDGVHLELELTDTRPFASGMVFVRDRVQSR